MFMYVNESVWIRGKIERTNDIIYGILPFIQRISSTELQYASFKDIHMQVDQCIAFSDIYQQGTIVCSSLLESNNSGLGLLL